MPIRVACLGWGSLIWDKTRPFPVQEAWRSDGPELPVEFGRQSGGDRITLVIVPGQPCVPVLWNTLSVNTLEEAVELLRQREGKIKREHIGCWQPGALSATQSITNWSKGRDFAGVIWTALPPKIAGDERFPDVAEVIEYLRQLIREGRSAQAKEYVRRAPKQIRTAYRKEIERQLGWDPSDA